jgi:hypothetical protein
MQRGIFQTSLSLQLTTLSESFRTALGAIRIGPNGYVPDMTAPDGPSTGGGAQATQHLMLLPPEERLPKLVVGRANKQEGTADLRTWEYLDGLCRSRFKQGAPVDREAYEQFLESARSFLAESGLRVTLSARFEEERRPVRSNTPGMLIILVVLLSILGFTVWWLFVRK